AAVSVADTRVGVLGLVTPAAVASRDAPKQDKVFVAELDLDRLWSLRSEPEPGVRALPRFPAVVRDISIAVSDALPAEIIRGTIQAAGRDAAAPLVAIRFFDRY